MDEKKAEYVAVPTTDYNNAPAPAPAPCGHCALHGQQPRRRRFCIVKLLMIGGAAALLAYNAVSYWRPAQHVDGNTMEQLRTPFDVAHPAGNFGFPKDTPGCDQVNELADFMSSLQATLAPHHKPQFAPECCHGLTTSQERGKKHKHHKHKHHKHKHHHKDSDKAVGEQAHDDGDKHGPGFRHRHPRTRMPPPKHHAAAADDEPRGCACAPPPPPPPAPLQLSEQEPTSPRPRHPRSFCPPNVDLNATSTVFSFSPDEFKRAALYIGHGFVDSGDVYFTKSGNKNIDSVKVKVTVLHGSDFVRDKVTISAFDHGGQYVVEMRHDLPPRHMLPPAPAPPTDGEPRGDLCVKYKIDVIFPASLESFEEFDLRAKDAHVGSCAGLQAVAFDRFFAGVGRGYLNFGALNAQFAKLGVLSGHIRGNYSAAKKLAAGVLHGTAEFTAAPISDKSRITSIVGRGLASVSVPAHLYEGDFVVHSSHQGTPAVQAPNPTDLHITKYRHNLKKGYYKTKDTGAFIAVHNRHGESKLTFV